MGKRLKRGQAGNAVQYMSRTQAMRKLQVKLSVFRRLCILKGIHPREPKKKTQGQNKTYYHAKDISFLAHDPLLAKFRDQWSFEKKIKKARAKKNRSLADALSKRRPSYRLDHLVKERYPAFVDALRDLDDPLTMANLFARLPAESAHDIPARVVATARRLALEFEAYVVRAHALRKVFVSVKGFYYQADIQGQAVTWLVPHNLAQVLPADVDYRVMLTFLEFYHTLLQFVNFKLYHSLAVHYPPVLDSKLEEAAAGLTAIMQDLAQGNTQPAPGADQQQSQAEATTAATATVEASAPQQQHALTGAQEAAAEDDAAAAGASGSDSDQDAGEIDSGDEEEASVSDPDAAEETAAPAGEKTSLVPHRHDISANGDSPAEPSGSAGVDSLAGGALRVQIFPQLSAAKLMHHPGKGHQNSLLGRVSNRMHQWEDDEAGICERLFRGLVFFLGREVPQEQLLFVIRAFGGTVAWHGAGSPMEEGDERITHQIVDRPTQGHKFLSRQYVQPQWVFDSANFRVLAKAELYAVGLVPPPHLSPFTQADDEGYVPDYMKTMLQLQEQAKAARQGAAGTMDEYTFVGEDASQGSPPGNATAQGLSEEQQYRAEMLQEMQADEADTEAAAPADHQEPAAATAAAAVEDAEPEATVMMTRKQRGLYNAMQRGLSKKRQRAESLQAKAKKLKQPVATT